MQKKKDHDTLFKILADDALEDLVSLTFPDLISWIGFNEAIKAEINLNDAAHLDNKLFADVVLIAPHKKNEDEVVIVHLEFQSYQQEEYKEKFAQRMFQYFCRIYGIYGDYFPKKRGYSKYSGKRCIYVPLAIMSHKCPQNTLTQYEIITKDMEWDEEYKVENFVVNKYNYRKVHLKKFNWKQYKDDLNIATIALLGNMDHKEDEKAEMKFLSVRKIYDESLEIDLKVKETLLSFIETYLELNEAQTKQFDELVKNLCESNPQLGGIIMEGLQEIRTKWHKQGEEKGIHGTIIAVAAEQFEITEKEVTQRLKHELAKINSNNKNKAINIILKSKTISEARTKLKNL